MPNYARVFMPGGTFFFTLVTYQRHPIFQQKQARHCLNSAFQEILQNKPFEIISIVLLPDHLHCVWTLPEGDNDFSTRWRWIKTQFTRKYGKFCNDERGLSQSRKNKQERGFWQRRFWEHMIRDEKELAAVCNYIHYNLRDFFILHLERDLSVPLINDGMWYSNNYHGDIFYA